MRARSVAALAFVFAVPFASVAFAQTAPGDAAPPATSAAPPATSAAPPATTAAPPATTAAPPATSAAPPATPPAAAPAKAEKKEPEWKPVAHTFAPEIGIGSSTRLGSSSAFRDAPIDRRTGLGMHLGVYYATNRTLTFGLQYDHSYGGREKNSGNIENSIDIERSIHAILGEVRVHPVVRDSGRLFVSLLLGGSYESSTMVLAYNAAPNSAVADLRSTKCSGAGSPSLAMGAGIGGDVELGGGFAFLVRTAFLGHRLSDAYIDGNGCRVPGAGSVPTLEAHVAFAYRLDLDKANKR